MIDNLCPHGRITTAYCEPCKIKEYAGAFPPTDYCGLDTVTSVHVGIKASDRQVGGTHYKDMPIQPHYFCHVNKLGALESNVVKYICRHNQKGGRKDLDKAKHYIDLLIEFEYEDTQRDLRKVQEEECSHRDGLGVFVTRGLEDTTEG